MHGSDWFTVSWVLWLLLFITFICHYWKWTRSRVFQLIDALPGPKTYPLIGSVLELNVDHDVYLKIVHFDWIRKYGRMFRVWNGTRPVVVLSTPELMEPILTSQKHMTKAAEYSFLSSWLGECMFLTTGTRWRNRRRLLTPAFHFQILNSFVEVFNEQSLACADKLERAIELSNGKPFDIFPIITECALDIICETSMGRQIRSGNEKAVYLENLHKIGQIVMKRGVRPWLQISDWIYSLTALGRENRECVKALHDFTNKVIKDRRAVLKQRESGVFEEQVNNNEEKKERLAFLDLLIKSSEDGAQLTDDDIREEVDTVMFAGHDTTASAMTWFLYCVSRHPEVQKELYEELYQVFGDSDRPCTAQDVSELKYLSCCIKESLRLYPSVPAIMRQLTEDVELGGHIIPAGTSIALMIYGMHHNPLVFEDPEAFKPERFSAENISQMHPYAFIPFSAGPRNCIGQKYGLLETKVVLANLLRRFQFTHPNPGEPLLVPYSQVVLKPKHDVSLIVSKRATGT